MRWVGWAQHLSLSTVMAVVSAVAFSFGALPTPAAAAATTERLDVLQAQIRADYPDVQQLTTAALAALPEPVLLIDVRAPEEFAQSRIPGAVNLSSASQIRAAMQIHPARPVVLYCSVGVRSSSMAQALQEGLAAAERSRIHNLDGAIFEWANQGRPLVNDRGPTKDVHPYSWWWGARYLR